ncbi:MAG: type II secretion system protein GspD, partial [Actinobacteria bacterium]|nr:type II secretion system protein GspD [Actinomycetota bacterium]
VGQSTQASRLSKIIPDDRTNSLIIVATQPAYLRILELIRRLDVPESGTGGDIHVHMLQHADAEELSGVLQNLQTGRRGAAKRPPREGQEGGGGPPVGGAIEGEVFEGDVRISPDKATNSLVIVSSLRDYASLRQVINRLDVQRRQVFVEAVIMEVSLSRVRRLGLAFHGGSTIDTGGEESLILGGTSYPQEGGVPFQSIFLDPTSLTGLAVGLRGPEIEGTEDLFAPGVSIPAFGVALQALQTDNDVNVLSTPNLLATDNTPAEISVGQNVPVQQGFLPGLLGAAAGAAAGAQQQGIAGIAGLLGGAGGGVPGSVGRQNVGLTLKMTPHVNDSDQVRIELELEVSEVLDRGNINPTISQRIAKTMLSVRDQQTVVLGGLIRDGESEHQDKVPILGDIPILGFFFRRTVTTKEKTNLLIVLTPYIIRDASDFRRIFYRKMEERREFIE